MDKKQQSKRKCIRISDYDYSSAGYYFVTICTNNHQMYLMEGRFRCIIDNFWQQIPEHFTNVQIDVHVVMPNHLHGIVEIVGAVHEPPEDRAIHELLLQKNTRRNMLVPKIISWFKMNTAKHINIQLKSSGKAFWQRNYYEHIIRDEKELNRIREYIINNPIRWNRDAENPENKKYGKNINIGDYYRNIFEVDAGEQKNNQRKEFLCTF